MKKIVVAVSGGFDPIHIGHLRLFEEPKKLGDKLIVILNGDRKNENDIPETKTCKRLDIKMIFNVGGGKIRSSSKLLKNYGN